MKKLLPIAIITLLFSTQSCTKNKTYFDQLKADKPFSSRILDLKKSFELIKKEEKGELIKEDLHLLEFAYNIGESDTYKVSYLFDEKGCYEIGVDGFFELEFNAKNIVTGIQTEMNTSIYGKGTDDNGLNRWKSEDKSISIELDYQETSKWMFLATIFANE